MFNHKNFATGGLFPGLVSTRSIANLGHFDIEIIIEPVYPGTGGGFGIAKPDKYKVTFRVTTKNGKVWNYSKTVSVATARVVARISKIKMEEPPEIIVHSIITKPQR